MQRTLIASVGAAAFAAVTGTAGCAGVEVVDPAAGGGGSGSGGSGSGTGGGGSGTGGGGSLRQDDYDLAFVMGDYDAASGSVSDCRAYVLDQEDPTLTSRAVGDARPLAASYGEAPRWSPDGTMLSYTDEDGRGHLVRLGPTGAADELLSQDPPGNDVDTAIVWSPDSTRVVTYQMGGSASDGLLVDVSQSPPEIVAHLGAFGGSYPLGFSPTGDRFAFTRDSGLFVVDTLSASPTPDLVATGFGSLWSTDGSHLFFQTEQAFYWVVADGSAVAAQVASGPFTPGGFVFPGDEGVALRRGDGVSSTAELVYFDLTQVPPAERSLSGPQPPMAEFWMAGSSTGRLAYIVDGLPFLFDGGGAPSVPIALPAPVAGDCRSPSWSPDGRWLAVRCSAANDDALTGIVDSADPLATPTVADGTCSTFSPDSTGLLCFRSSGLGGTELRWLPLGGGTAVTIAEYRTESFLGLSELVSLAFSSGGHDLAYHLRTYILDADDPPPTNQLLLFEPDVGASRVLATGLCEDRIAWRPTAPSP